MVSSAAWAEASKPVIVYAGSSNPSANSQASDAAAAKTAPGIRGQTAEVRERQQPDRNRIDCGSQQRERQYDRHDQDPPAAEIGQHARHANAQMVDDRLRSVIATTATNWRADRLPTSGQNELAAN